MAQTIKLKRSAVAAKEPGTGDLALGELAINTYDGKMYFKKDSGTASIVRLANIGEVVTLTGDQTIAGVKTFSDTTASNSTTTGALVVAGGVGIGGALYTGTDAFINGARVGVGPAGTDNTVLGVSAGAALQAGGIRNVLIGARAGDVIQEGDECVAVGADALGANVSGLRNVAVGYSALLRQTGNDAVGIGTNAASVNTANDTIAIGSSCLLRNTLGTANVAVGRSALGAATTAIATVTTTDAGTGGTDGAKTAIQLERDSGGTMVTYPTVNLTVTDGAVSGTVTVATGGSASTSSTAGGIIFRANAAGIALGVPANWRCQLQTVSTAANNTAVGYQAGDAITSGEFNTALGSGALGACTSGSYNVALGPALGALTSGSDNMGIGLLALASLQTGVNNVAVGRRSLQSISGAASGSVGIGNQAGRYQGSGTTELTSATDSVFIGHNSRANGNSQSNQVVIAGLNGLGDGSNTTVIGNTSTTSTRIPAGNLTLSNTGSASDTSGLTVTAASGATIRVQASDGSFGDPTIGTYTNNPIIIKTNQVLRAQFDTSGNVRIQNGNVVFVTAGTGIDFSATANSSGTMTSELLDDYEEGTWTPDFTTTGVDFTTMTVDIRSAVYTKVGRLVTVTAYIRTDNVDTTGATGNMIISGLPFTAVATTGWSAINISDVTAWVNAPVNGYIVPNTTDIYLNKAGANGNTQSLARTDFTSGATADQNTLIFSGLYYTAT